MTHSERAYLVLAGVLVLLAVCMTVLLAAIPVGARGADPTPMPDACYIPKGGPVGNAPAILPTCSPVPRPATPWPTATDAPTVTRTPNPYPAWGSK